MKAPTTKYPKDSTIRVKIPFDVYKEAQQISTELVLRNTKDGQLAAESKCIIMFQKQMNDTTNVAVVYNQNRKLGKVTS